MKCINYVPLYLDFFGPKWQSFRPLPFQGPKSLDFQGPPLPMPLVNRNDVARLKTSTYRAK
jgi:hypothetical protein